MTIVAASAAVLLGARPSHACTCGVLPSIQPHDGAADVPTNPEILLLNSSFPFVALVGPDGDVPLAEPERVWTLGFWRVTRIRVVGEIDPHTTYQVVDRHVAGDQTVLSTFVTGEATATEAPPSPTVNHLSVVRVDLGTATICDDRPSIVKIDTEVLDAPTYGLTLSGPGGPHSLILSPEMLEAAGSLPGGNCSFPFEIQPGATYCIELTARDLAGNESPPATACAVARACAAAPGDELDLDLCNEPPAARTGSGCATTPARGSGPVTVVLALAVLAIGRGRGRVRRRRT